MAAEVIREQILMNTSEEIPYAAHSDRRQF